MAVAGANAAKAAIAARASAERRTRIVLCSTSRVDLICLQVCKSLPLTDKKYPTFGLLPLKGQRGRDARQ